MYLSRAELDPTRRSTMIALTSPQKFHGAVENSFSGERRRRLWRLDSLNGKLYLLLLSEELPGPEALLSGSGAGTVAAGAGREARLCPDGGRFSGDPETDLSLPEERKAAGHIAGGDL